MSNMFTNSDSHKKNTCIDEGIRAEAKQEEP